jgi:hypothetical protein
MPGGKKNKQKASQAPWGQIRLGGFKAEFPQPRIPRILGADTSLGAGGSVYPTVMLDVPIAIQIATIAAGATATVIPLDTTAVNGWAGRFAATFREYAIVGAALELRLNNVATTAGLVLAFLDEVSNAAPTATMALDRARLDMTCGPLFVPKAYRMKWVPRDLLDLDYTAIGTNFTPVWLKLFSSVADTQTNVATTGQVLVTGTLALTFRGYI